MLKIKEAFQNASFIFIVIYTKNKNSYLTANKIFNYAKIMV